MSWQWADEPSHIAPETGPNLLTGSGPWTVALVPGVEYALTVDVLGEGDTLVEWQVSVTDGETGDLDYPTISETVPGGEWVTVARPLTAPAFEASASVALTAAAETRDPSLAALTGRTVLTVPGDVLAETIMASGGIVAGTPGGARVELTDEGLAAFDTDGTETAQIRGAGGEFVGGEFRTSDQLPGQVTLADDAYVDAGSQNTYPGIRITPVDPSGYVTHPGIGPNSNGMIITGGRTTAGGRGYTIYAKDQTTHSYRQGLARSDISVRDQSAFLDADDGAGNQGYVRATPSYARVRTDAADGSYGVIEAAGSYAVAATRDPGGNYMSQIRSNGREAFLRSNGSDGLGRSLSVDSDGIWVKKERSDGSGYWDRYNLEETAQDSGWQAITPATGYQNASGGAPFEYRRMGGMIHLRGRVSATSGVLTAGTAYTIGTLPAGVRPAYTHRTIIAGGSASSWGRIDISGGTGTLTVAPISANMNWVDLAGTMWTVD